MFSPKVDNDIDDLCNNESDCLYSSEHLLPKKIVLLYKNKQID